MKCFQLCATHNNLTGNITYYVQNMNDKYSTFKRISKVEYETTKGFGLRLDTFFTKSDKNFTRKYVCAYY